MLILDQQVNLQQGKCLLKKKCHHFAMWGPWPPQALTVHKGVGDLEGVSAGRPPRWGCGGRALPPFREPGSGTRAGLHPDSLS